MLIVYDDFQLPLGTIRIRSKGGDGGHNGITSIIYHLSTVEFPRMRNGIGNDCVLKKDDFVDYVLSDFSNEEFEKIKILLPYYTECIENFLCNSLKTVMNKFNKNFLDAEINGLNGTIDSRLD
jgi:peptidyl-tRNA hydrolase, PTH1 family